MKAMKRNHGIVIQYLSRKLNELSQKVEQCFQSVSNGKTLIASAITDKKIPTDADATFAEMASNIESLKLGSGNAVQSDVKKGKTFTNSDGIEYTGTYDFASATSATAAAADITSGKTAWVNGSKITGTSTAKKIKEGTTPAGTTSYQTVSCGFTPSILVIHSYKNSGSGQAGMVYLGASSSTYYGAGFNAVNNGISTTSFLQVTNGFKFKAGSSDSDINGTKVRYIAIG